MGLSDEVIERYFTRTPSRIGGIGLEEIGQEVLQRHRRAFSKIEDGPEELEVGGEYQLRVQGPPHQWNQHSIPPLQRAVETGSFETYKEYSNYFNERSENLFTLRGLLDFRRDPIPLEEVEPAKEIVKRFSTGAISFGSISKESHETLAIAMNRIGGKSNTGEGGEDSERYTPDGTGDIRRSAIKQVARAVSG